VIASFQNSEQKLTKFVNFWKFPEIPAEYSVIPGNSRREFLGWRITGNGPDITFVIGVSRTRSSI